MMAALRYEWRRMRSLRSTWVMALLSVAQAAVFATLFFAASRAFDPAYAPYQATSLRELVLIVLVPFFPVLLSVIAAQAFGHDYRHGTIRLTLSAFPRRWEVLVARIIVASVFMLLVTVVTVGAVGAVTELFADVTGGLDWSTVPAVGWRLLALIALYMLAVMSIVIITRNLALGIVLPMVWWLIVENILGAIAALRLPELNDWLPMSNFQNWVMASDSAYGDSLTQTLPLLALAGGLLLWSSLTFLKRDA